MKHFFAPAIVVMDKLRYPVKFGLIFLIVLIPLLLLSINLISSINKEISFIENERIGLAYIKTVRQPIEHIQQHRGMTAAYINGASEFKDRIMQKRTIVDQKMAELQKVDSELAKQLGLSNAFSSLDQQWQAIKANSMQISSAEAIKAHSTLISSMLTLMSNVADASEITLDPELDSYYMGDALVAGLPNLLENMGQARAVGSGVAAKGSFTDQKVYVKLAVLANNIQLYAGKLNKGLQAAFQNNEAIAKHLGNQVTENVTAIDKIQNLLHKDLLDVDTITINSDSVFDTATTAISGSYQLYDALVPELDKLFMQRIESGKNTILIATSIVVIVLALVAYLFTGFYFSVRQSIEQISAATEKLADGDLTVMIKLHAHDEMSEIADRFNTMTQKFSGLIQQVFSASTQLATAAEEVSAVALDNAKNVDLQRQETDQVATAINEMTATVQEVSSNASSASEAANNADIETAAGKSVVINTAQSISQLAREIENASGVIKTVAQDSATIGSVLDVIKSIAEQTNLLALNAAIEAARAGEQGRGFAVVADEVRTLASRTQESTSEIEEMIGKLQSGSKNAVAVMEKSQQQAQEGVEQANKAAQSLDAIAHAVATINDMNTQIASAAEEQSSVSEEINRNVISISDISAQSAASAEQATESASAMAQLSAELQALVSQFKVLAK
ncbi:MAG: methyl-accepting chemotaxis protein [Gammaproteobacteria bacterium]|nr:methyl-accepting chemotaxis protein [Gammaproteobacteria bacterium]